MPKVREKSLNKGVHIIEEFRIQEISFSTITTNVA